MVGLKQWICWLVGGSVGLIIGSSDGGSGDDFFWMSLLRWVSNRWRGFLIGGLGLLISGLGGGCGDRCVGRRCWSLAYVCGSVDGLCLCVWLCWWFDGLCLCVCMALCVWWWVWIGWSLYHGSVCWTNTRGWGREEKKYCWKA